jgi:hypothetical protein
VASAQLLGLEHKMHACAGNGSFNSLRKMADDNKNVGRSRDLAGCRNHMRQQRLASDFVQHLGPPGLQPRPFARSHDDYCQTQSIHLA